MDRAPAGCRIPRDRARHVRSRGREGTLRGPPKTHVVPHGGGGRIRGRRTRARRRDPAPPQRAAQLGGRGRAGHARGVARDGVGDADALPDLHLREERRDGRVRLAVIGAPADWDPLDEEEVPLEDGTAVTVGLRWLRASIALATCPPGPLAPLRPLLGQDTSATRDTTPPPPPGHFHVGLTINDWGVSLGNAPRVNGIRVNVEDAGLERVNGVNITVWKPREPLTGSVNGLALGIVGPGAAELNGAQVGLAGVVAERHVRWLSVGGLGVVSQGAIEGVSVGGLGVVAEGGIRGIALAGLGVVAQGEVRGLVIAGLGAVTQRDLSGLTVAGLGAVAEGDLRGLVVGGVGAVSQGRLTGVGISALAVVAEQGIDGLGLSGLATVAAGNIHGVSVAGYRVAATRLAGLSLAGLTVTTRDMDGLSSSAYNRVRGLQRGLAIGLYNSADQLNGVQIGILNRAKNNRAPFKILPILNVQL